MDETRIEFRFLFYFPPKWTKNALILASAIVRYETDGTSPKTCLAVTENGSNVV